MIARSYWERREKAKGSNKLPLHNNGSRYERDQTTPLKYNHF